VSEKVGSFSDKNPNQIMTQAVDNKLISRIYGFGRGYVFTPNHFLDLGSRDAVDKSLSRLTAKGTIRRLARGLYDYPRKHPDLGNLSPEVEKVAKALAGKDQIRLQPSGAYAANLLHLSEQVPARVVFLTDGPARKVQIGKQTVELRRTTPRNMATAGQISGLVIQALRHLGKANVNRKRINTLRSVLSAKDRKQLLKDLPLAPVWMHSIFREIAEE